MCGIAGMVRLDGGNVEQFRLEAMNRTMKHRGPDGDNCWVKGPVGLSHLRLAIIDLVTGDQPMFNEDHSVLIVFNGEIYNYLDLKPELLARGHIFRTNSDTEVLLHAYEEWGSEMIKRINGMFAFAIYDSRKNRLLLARDRVGVKPLYYYHSKDCLVFASELSGLIASGMVPCEVDRQALELYLHYQYVPSPYTIYQNVNKLSPAEYAELDLDSGTLSKHNYWQLNTAQPPDTSKSMDEWMEELDALLNDATKIRLMSDVPFGAFLSGGVDSGTVVAMMAGKMSEPVKTFSIGLDGIDKDELPYARKVAERYHTQHEEFHVTPEGLSLIPKLCAHFGEPFADSSAIPTYYVSQIAHSQVKMVLTGDGGDEMLGGYRSYAYLLSSILAAKKENMLKGLVSFDTHSGMRDLPRQAYRNLRQTARLIRYGGKPWYVTYDRSMSHFHPEERLALLGQTFPISPHDYFYRRFNFKAADSEVEKAQYCDLNSYLPEDVLVKVDRMSMAHSLEVRSPFLDYRVAELAFRIPTRFKVPEPQLDGMKNKYILKELAAKRYLGRDYVYRPKEGFGIPVNRWLREDTDSYVHDTLMSSSSPIYKHVDRTFAQNMVKRHLDGVWENGYKIWNLLMLDSWLRHAQNML